MATYRSKNTRTISGYNASQRSTGQVILSGTNPSISCPGGIFFLEMLQVDDTGAGVTITDGNSVAIATGVKSFSQDQSPVRCDDGLTLTGTVIMAKGFVVEGCL